jgi:hypothetical protein
MQNHTSFLKSPKCVFNPKQVFLKKNQLKYIKLLLTKPAQVNRIEPMHIFTA